MKPTVFLASALSLVTSLVFAEVEVDAELPAGNIVFEKIEGDTVSVHQGLYDLRARPSVAFKTSKTATPLVASAGAVVEPPAEPDPVRPWNTWCAAADGRAGVAANWSLGRVPTAADVVRFDGDVSNAACEWDASSPVRVGGWVQEPSYTNTVQIDTTLDEHAFPALVVTGDVSVCGGRIAPCPHGTSLTPTYILRMEVGGDFTIGEAGAVTAAARGLYIDNKTWGGCAAHGGDSGSYDKNTGKTTTHVSNDPAYGDVLAPMSPAHGSCSGTDSADKKSHGGGAIRLSVGGDFTNRGVVTSDGEGQNAASGAGGSIYVTAANIYGPGSYTASVPAQSKSDGSGAVGSGGRIALVASGVNEATDIACYGRKEAWGKRGGAGTVYFRSSTVNEIRVKGNDADIKTTTPVPSASDSMDWTRAGRWVDLVGSDYAHLRLAKGFARVNVLSLLATGKKSDLDLCGNVLKVAHVIIDGEDLHLASGDYTLADAERKGWSWLTDSSSGRTGILRVLHPGLYIHVR